MTCSIRLHSARASPREEGRKLLELGVLINNTETLCSLYSSLQYSVLLFSWINITKRRFIQSFNVTIVSLKKRQVKLKLYTNTDCYLSL